MNSKTLPRSRQPSPSRDLSLGAALFTIFLCTLFGANAVAIKISLTGIGVFTTILLRFSIASTVLICWALWRHIPLKLNRPQTLQLSIVSLVFFVQMSAIYHGQKQTTAAHGTLIANLLPFVIMILAHFFIADDRIRPRKAIGLALGFAGVMLLLVDSINMPAGALRGDLVILCAIILWGCNVVFIKRIIADFHPLQVTLFPMLFTVPLFLCAALLFDDRMIFAVSPPVIKALFYQALVTASFGFIMWNTLISKFGATALHSFIFIVPISGVTCGALLLDEQITPNLIGAIGLVTTALILVNYRKKKTGRS